MVCDFLNLDIRYFSFELSGANHGNGESDPGESAVEDVGTDSFLNSGYRKKSLTGY